MDRRKFRFGKAWLMTAAVLLLCAIAALWPAVAWGAPDDAAAEPAAAPALCTTVPDANRAQLVIVVRFSNNADEESLNRLNGTEGAPKWTSVLEDLNYAETGALHRPSVYQYLKGASDGACRLESVAPQTDAATGSVRYLTLSRTREYYAGTYGSDELLRDAVEAFNKTYGTFNGKSLDGDGDRVVDNVLIIPELGSYAPTSGSPLWPHKSNYGGEIYVGSGANAVRVGTYTVVGSTSVGMGAGTLVHETMHVFGAKDLYRSNMNDQTASPVGVWDIMGKVPAARLMRPLAVSRQDCGWTAIPEVSAGTYTLYAPGSGKRQAVKVRTPYSTSEYFVLEYRKAAYGAGDYFALDTWTNSDSNTDATIGGSGLLVYRVNPAMEGGNKGDKDYAYIFREGETGGPRGDGAGKIRFAELTAPDFMHPSALFPNTFVKPPTRNEAGTADLSKQLTDGALTYSDGQNSGMVVKVTAQTDDSITFTVTVPDAQAVGLWSEAQDGAGASPLPKVGVQSAKLVVGADGALYQLCVQDGAKGALVYRYDGSAWQSYGIVGAGYGDFDIACFNGSVYVAGVKYGSNPFVMTLWQLNGASWRSLGQVSAACNKPVLGQAAGALYLLDDGNGGTAQLYKLQGNSLVKAASLSGHYLTGGSIIEAGGAPAVVAGSFWQHTTKLFQLQGGSWKETELHTDGAQVTSAVSVGSARYVLTSSNNTLRLVYWTSGGVPTVVDLSQKLPKAYAASLATDGSKLYIALAEPSGSQRAFVYAAPLSAPGGAWTLQGRAVISPAQSVAVAPLGGTVLCAAVDAQGAASLRRLGTINTGTVVAPPAVAPSASPATPSKPAGSTSAGSGALSGSSSSGAPSSAVSASSSSSASAAKPPAVAKPGKVAISKLTKAKRAFTVKWKKVKGATGYQVTYSTSKKFTKKTTKTKKVTKASRVSLKVTKLKAKKTYYVKVRAYKKVGGKYYYGAWSKVKKVKTR